MSWQSETRDWMMALAFTACFGGIAFKVITAPAIPDLNPTVAKVNATMANLDNATGAWAAASTQQTKSVTAIENDVRAQLWHLDRALTALDGTVIVARGTLQAATGTIDTANEQITRVGPALDEAASAMASANLAVRQIAADADISQQDIHAFITAPDLTDTIHHVAGMSASGDEMLADSAYKLHQFVHPDKKKLGLWGTLDAAVAWFHGHLEPPIF